MAAEKVSNDEKPTEYLEKVALDDSGRGFVPPSAIEESAVIRKLDWHLLPLVFVLYSLSVLDRSNLGNAKLAGMTKDINLTGNRYNWLGTLFYIAYILFQWTIIGWKHFSPHRWAAVVVFFWGFVATIQATTSNWGGLMTCRFFLGVAEAMFGPGVPLYLSYFYPRENVGFRHGIFISGAAMANAYGSALAYGISQIRGSVAPWKILFIIEGVPTCLIAIIAWFFLPDSLLSARFLNEREKAVAAHFVARNQKVEEGSEKSGIRFRELFEAFKDPKSYIPGIMYFSCNVSFASLPLFMPTIISEMGSFSQIQSNGLSAPPYLLCFFTIIILSFLSDRFRMRGPFCAFAALVAAIGFILQATTKSVTSRYFGVFLSVNIFASVALLLAWTANLHATESKRAGGYTILATIGQCGPLLGTNVFPESEKPYYHKGMWISCAFCLLVTVLSVALSLHLVRENRKMERAGLLVPQGSEIVDAPSNGEFAERKIRYIY
jgi:MFS family permease